MSKQIHGSRPSGARGLLSGLAAVALTLLLAAAPHPAAAMMVTAPNVPTLQKGVPVQVTWLSNYPSYAVDIEFEQINPYVYGPRTMLVSNITGTNQQVVTLPSSVSCDPKYLYDIFVTSHQGDKTGDANTSRAFRFTCPREEPLTVVKEIINNNPGVPTPTGPFQIQVDCSPNGPHTVVNLTSPNHLQQVVGVPVGSACSVVELTPPPPPKPCKWVTSYPTGGPKSAVGITRTVVNELKCDGNGRQEPVTVVKRVINNNPGVPTPAGPFQVQLDCRPNGPHTVVTLTSPNNLQQVVGVPVGSACSITELPPPPPPRPCKWVTTYPNGGPYYPNGGPKSAIGQTLTVVNELKCDGGTTPFSVAKKIINNNPGVPTPVGPYQIKVDCSPNGPHTTVNLTSPNNLQQVLQVPTGSVCAISELAPPPPPKGCEWIVSYPDGREAKAGGGLYVLNELKCGGRTQPLTVVKRIINNNPGVPTPVGPYQIKVDCNPSGPHTVVSLTSPNNLQQVLQVPVGSACSLTEIAAPPPPKPCKWVTSYPGDMPGPAGEILTVVNELKCDGGTSPFTVLKRVVNNNPGIPTPIGPYLVKVDCNPSGPHTTVSLTSPGGLQQVLQVPTGSVCTIVELPPPPPPKGCEWSVSYPEGQTGRAGGLLIVVNELKCGGRTEPLTVVKRIVNNTGMPTPVGPYQIQIDCNPSGPHTTVNLTSPNNLQQVVQVPVGSACTVSEPAPPPPPKPCKWTTTYPTGGPRSASGEVLTVVNTLTCDGRTDPLTISKRIVNNNPGVPTPTGPYQIKVDCYPLGPHTIVNLTSPGGLQQVVQVPAGNGGCVIAEIAPPAPKGCEWITTYPGGQKSMPGSASLVVVNELKCSGGPTGTLEVIKRIVNNNPGVPTPFGPYQVKVDCNPSGPHTTVSLTSPNNLQQVVQVPVGSLCTIVELPPPPPPKGCEWSVSYPEGQQSRTGGALLVVNELKCGGGTSPFTVIKRVHNDNPGVPVPTGPYQVKVDCSPNGPHVTVALTSPNSLQQVLQVPTGSVCSIVELPPPPPPTGCQWSVSYPGGQQGPAGGSLLVLNELKCGHQTGPLTIVKRVVNNNPSVPTPTGPFLVQVNCSPNGPNTSVTLVGPNYLQSSVIAPIGSQCTIAELPPAAIPRCHWSTTYPNGQQGAPGGTLVVVNELKCETGPTGSLTVTKRIVNNNAGVQTPTGPYQIKVDCNPSGPHTTVSLTSPGNLQQTLAVPLNSGCTVAELPPPPPPKGCEWSVSYPGGQQAKTGGSVAVVNELKCKQQTGPLTIIKRVVDNYPGIPTPTGPFIVQVNCSPNGPNTSVTLTGPGYLQSSVIAPLGSQCTITELPPTPILRCRWVTTYPNGQQGAPGSTLVVVNSLACPGTSSGGPAGPGSVTGGSSTGAVGFPQSRKGDPGGRK